MLLLLCPFPIPSFHFQALYAYINFTYRHDTSKIWQATHGQTSKLSALSESFHAVSIQSTCALYLLFCINFSNCCIVLLLPAHFKIFCNKYILWINQNQKGKFVVKDENTDRLGNWLCTVYSIKVHVWSASLAEWFISGICIIGF